MFLRERQQTSYNADDLVNSGFPRKAGASLTRKNTAEPPAEESGDSDHPLFTVDRPPRTPAGVSLSEIGRAAEHGHLQPMCLFKGAFNLA